MVPVPAKNPGDRTGLDDARMANTSCRQMDLRIVNLRGELPAFYRKLGYANLWPQMNADKRR